MFFFKGLFDLVLVEVLDVILMFKDFVILMGVFNKVFLIILRFMLLGLGVGLFEINDLYK